MCCDDCCYLLTYRNTLNIPIVFLFCSMYLNVLLVKAMFYKKQEVSLPECFPNCGTSVCLPHKNSPKSANTTANFSLNNLSISKEVKCIYISASKIKICKLGLKQCPQILSPVGTTSTAPQPQKYIISLSPQPGPRYHQKNVCTS